MFMSTGQVLTSWKEIAAYMGKGVRTVQRWEAEMDLPVRRPAEDRHIVLAFPSELDAWARRQLESPAVVKPSLKQQHDLHTHAQLLRMRNLVQIMRDRLEQNRAFAERLRQQCESSRFAAKGRKRTAAEEFESNRLSQSA
jgi:NADH pyrophosphatase NudC (nudix superfamily)